MAILKVAGASLAAAAAAGALYVLPQDPARVDAAASPVRPVDPEAVRSKLAIYSQPDRQAVLVPVKTPLQDQVAAARKDAAAALHGMVQKGEEGKAQWLEWEKAAEGKVASVISARDQLNPNGIYVAVATLAGSVVGRSRGLLLRASLPPAFLLLSTSYFLPHTWANVRSAAEQFEAAHMPRVRDLRQQVAAKGL
ncbi:hypothetical protein JCM10213_003532 [Rhodosporidiobolus nylandii]